MSRPRSRLDSLGSNPRSGRVSSLLLAPRSTLNKLNAAINEALKSKDLQASLATLSAKPKIGSPQDFAVFIAAETQRWAEVAILAGIEAN
jgi:tripartite-type tricarboxylate transporter receptor subunit TctC